MKPVLLDLFSGAGGAGEGYRIAGFHVIGVDIDAHDYPPGDFRKGDAIRALKEVAATGMFGGVFIDAIHLSPPCQRWATGTRDPEAHPDYITPARPLLEAWGGSYVIENVPGAPLVDPVMLCGSSFSWGDNHEQLRVRRHRHFETNFPLTRRRPECRHKAQGTPVGVYGDHPDSREYFRPDGGRRGARATSLAEGSRAMGIDWMTWEDLKESIPPAYTNWIGAQLLDLMEVAA